MYDDPMQEWAARELARQDLLRDMAEREAHQFVEHRRWWFEHHPWLARLWYGPRY